MGDVTGSATCAACLQVTYWYFTGTGYANRCAAWGPLSSLGMQAACGGG